ncbi:11971_t:CDS:2, partial [Cetraspora pellucida]
MSRRTRWNISHNIPDEESLEPSGVQIQEPQDIYSEITQQTKLYLDVMSQEITESIMQTTVAINDSIMLFPVHIRTGTYQKPDISYNLINSSISSYMNLKITRFEPLIGVISDLRQLFIPTIEWTAYKNTTFTG